MKRGIQCDCGAKMKPVPQDQLAPEIQAILGHCLKRQPAISIKAHVCPRCQHTHVHMKV